MAYDPFGDDILARNKIGQPIMPSAESSFTQGLRSGMQGAGGQLAALGGMGAEVLGADQVAQGLYGASKGFQERAQAYAPPVSSFRDVTGLSSGFDYATGLVGQSLPQIAAATAAGVLTRGRSLAPTLAMAPFEIGEQVQRQQADPVSLRHSPLERAGVATGAGGLSALLQSYIPAKIGGQVAGTAAKQAAKESIGQIVKRNLLSIPEEGIFEAGGEGVQQAGQMVFDPSKKFDTGALAEAFVGGAAAGTPMAGAGTVADVAHGRAQQVADAATALKARAGELVDKVTPTMTRAGEQVTEAGETALDRAAKVGKKFAGLFDFGKKGGADPDLDNMAAGRELSDTADGIAAAEPTRLQKTKQWIDELLGDAGMDDATRERLRAAADNIEDRATQTWVAGLQKARNLAKKGKETVDNMWQDVRKWYTDKKAGAGAEGDIIDAETRVVEDLPQIGGPKRSEFNEGLRSAISDVLRPEIAGIEERHPGLMKNPDAVNKLADSLRMVAEMAAGAAQGGKVGILPEQITGHLRNVLGDEGFSNVMGRVFDVMKGQGVDPKAEERFFANINAASENENTNRRLEGIVRSNLTDQALDSVKINQLPALVRTLRQFASGELTRGMGKERSRYEEAAAMGKIRELFGDKADVVLAAIEKSIPKKEPKAPSGKTEARGIEGMEGGFEEDIGSVDKPTKQAVDLEVISKKPVPSPEKHMELYGSTSSQASEQIAKADAANPGSKARWVSPAEYRRMTGETKRAPEGHGWVISEKIDPTDEISLSDVRFDSSKGNRATNPSVIDIGEDPEAKARADGTRPHILLDAKKLARVGESRAQRTQEKGAADDKSEAHRRARVFMEAVAKVQDQLGRAFNIPDDVQISGNMTMGDAKKLGFSPPPLGSKTVLANIKQLEGEVAAARGEYKQAKARGASEKELAELAKNGKKLADRLVDMKAIEQMGPEDEFTTKPDIGQQGAEQRLAEARTAYSGAKQNKVSPGVLERMAREGQAAKAQANAPAQLADRRAELVKQYKGSVRESERAAIFKQIQAIDKEQARLERKERTNEEPTKEDVIDTWGSDKQGGIETLRRYTKESGIGDDAVGGAGALERQQKQLKQTDVSLMGSTARETERTGSGRTKAGPEEQIHIAEKVLGEGELARKGARVSDRTIDTPEFSSVREQRMSALRSKIGQFRDTAKGKAATAVARRMQVMLNNFDVLSDRDKTDLLAMAGAPSISQVTAKVNDMARRVAQHPKFDVNAKATPSNLTTTRRGEAKEEPPGPKAVAAKKAAFLEKARSGDKDLIKTLSASTDAKGLQRAGEALASEPKTENTAKVLDAINLRIGELVQDPDTSYGMNLKSQYSLQNKVGAPNRVRAITMLINDAATNEVIDRGFKKAKEAVDKGKDPYEAAKEELRHFTAEILSDKGAAHVERARIGLSTLLNVFDQLQNKVADVATNIKLNAVMDASRNASSDLTIDKDDAGFVLRDASTGEHVSVGSPLENPETNAFGSHEDAKTALAEFSKKTNIRRIVRLGDLMDIIKSTATSEDARALAEVLKQTVGKTEVKSTPLDDLLGLFSFETGHIDLNSDMPTSMTTVLHEGVHAATIGALVDNPALAEAFTKLHEHIQKAAPELSTAYGMTDVNEMIAEGLTNAGFQAQLKKIPVSSKVAEFLGQNIANAWEAFTTFIRTALGIDPSHQNALTQLLDLSGHAMAETFGSGKTSRTLEEYWRRGNSPEMAARAEKAWKNVEKRFESDSSQLAAIKKLPTTLKEQLWTDTQVYHAAQVVDVMVETDPSLKDEDTEHLVDHLINRLEGMMYTNNGIRFVPSRLSSQLHMELGRTGFAATHDSPTKHAGQFDWRKYKGQGEGHAAFGAGTYLSTAEGVHESYKQAFSQGTQANKVMVNGVEMDPRKKFAEFRKMSKAEQIIVRTLEKNPDLKGNDILDAAAIKIKEDNDSVLNMQVSDAIDALKSDEATIELAKANGWSNDADGDGPKNYKALRELADKYKLEDLSHVLDNRDKAMQTIEEIFDLDPKRFSVKRGEKSPTYHVSVDIPPEQLLNWDAPVDKQSQHVQNALDKLGTKHGITEAQSGAEFYHLLEHKLGSQNAASETLNAAGILGHKYAPGGLRGAAEATHPNFVIFDDSKINTNYVHFSRMGANPNRNANNQGPVNRKAVEDYIKKVLGDKVALEWAKMNYGGQFEEAVGGAMPTIRLSIHSLNPMSMAYHESLHAFFDQLRSMQLPEVMNTLYKAANSAHVMKQLRTLLKDEPDALKQISNSPEERVAYMYQFWAAGQLNMNAKAETVFEKLAKYFRSVLGIWSNDQRALHIMEHFQTGEYAKNMNKRSAVARALLEPGRNAALEQAKQMSAPLLRIAEAVTSSGGSRIRDYGIEPLTQLADLLRRERTGEGTDTGFVPASRLARSRWTNSLGRKLEGLSQADLDQMVDGLQREDLSGITKPEARIAAREISKMLNTDLAGYMERAGVEFKRIEGGNYFPRVWDPNLIAEDQKAFKTMLQKNGVTDPDGLVQFLMGTGGNEYGIPSDRPGMQHLKERTLKGISPQDAAPFLRKDLRAIMSSYINQATRRAEWARRFGDKSERIIDLLDRAKKQGATMEQIDSARKYLRSVDGTLGDTIDPNTRKLFGNMIVYQNVRLLPLAIFSSLVDANGIIVRGGTVGDAWSTFKRGIKEMRNNFRKENVRDADERMAETLGVIDHAMMMHSIGEMYSESMVGNTSKAINDKFFKYNLMEQWNRSMRIGASQAALKFLARHKTGTDEHSARFLSELGLEPSDIKIGSLGEVENIKDPKIISAVNRWVDGAILRPDASDKPIWMNDPHFALVAHLKQFVYTFQKTILERVAHEFRNGNYKPAMALAGYVPMMIAADGIKGMAFGGGDDREKDATDYLWKGVQRAGLLGVGQFGLDVAGYGAVNALGGPTLEQFGDAINVIGGDDQFSEFAVKSMPANALYKHAVM